MSFDVIENFRIATFLILSIMHEINLTRFGCDYFLISVVFRVLDICIIVGGMCNVMNHTF